MDFKPNVFKLSRSLGFEDTLTAYWHYLLTVVPGIGQRFVDLLVESCGLPAATFAKAEYHPPGDGQSRPDLLLSTDAWHVAFEHKVDAGFGDRQLERYLVLCEKRGWHLALMSAGRMEVPQDVRASPLFLKPQHAADLRHFLWRDLFRVLDATDHHLAREFAEFLEWEGLGRFVWAGFGDPFVDRDAGDALVGLYAGLTERFRRRRLHCRTTPNSLIYQIRKPFEHVHLVNVGPRHSIAEYSPSSFGPAMEVWVWVQREKPEQRVLSFGSDRPIDSAVPLCVIDHAEPETYSPRAGELVYNERSYFAPLAHILQPTLELSRARLVEYVSVAMADLEADLASHRPQ